MQSRIPAQELWAYALPPAITARSLAGWTWEWLMQTVAGARAVPSYLLASPAARIGGYLADFLILLPVRVG